MHIKMNEYVEEMLIKHINESINNEDIKKYMLYSIEGGSRIRPLIHLNLVDLLSTKNSHITPEQKEILKHSALYVEYIHCASLILDDSPYMDNDKYRRNKLTCHFKFGIANSIMTAFLLIQLAHQLLSNNIIKLYQKEYYTSEQLCNLMIFLNNIQYNFLGENGLVGGQMIDLSSKTKRLQPTEYLKMIRCKTSSLFELSTIIPYCLTSKTLDQEIFEKYKQIGTNIGIMYQLLDDATDNDARVTDASVQTWINEHHKNTKIIAKTLNLDLSFVWNLMTRKFGFSTDYVVTHHDDALRDTA